MAAEAGVDIVDTAISSMSSLSTSQPSMNAVVAAFEGHNERDTGICLDELQKLTDYWADVRLRYESSMADSSPPSLKYTNTRHQAASTQTSSRRLSLSVPGSRFVEVEEMYATVKTHAR